MNTRLAAGLAALLTAVTVVPVDAQLVRGSVRALETSLPVPAVQIVIRDTTGLVVAAGRTDDQGLFAILVSRQTPFVVQARRLGYQLADTDVLRFTPADTLELEFRLAQVVLEADAMEVTAMAQLNEQRLDDAYRRGWRVYEPELVALHSARARDLETLLRNVVSQSLVMPRSSRECIRSARTNQCITYVVDGQVLGTENLFMPASEIYFFAILSPAESRAIYGNRAMNGAIAIYTRAAGDRVQPGGNRPTRPQNATSARRP